MVNVLSEFDASGILASSIICWKSRLILVLRFATLCIQVMPEAKEKPIRIPAKLIDRVRLLADKKQSTVPKQVVYLLEKALESENIKEVS